MEGGLFDDEERRARGATQEVGRNGVDHGNLRSRETPYPRAKSYYVGPEILGKPRLVMLYSGGVRAYQRMPERVAEGGYKSFLLRRYLASSIMPRV